MRYLSPTETRIVNKLIDAILSRGLTISVNDGEDLISDHTDNQFCHEIYKETI